jgi:hypothetical protein
MVGNPPFLNQLNSATATHRGLASIIKARTGSATSAYTDTAAAIWIDAFSKTADGSRVAFLLPQSVLASRDASSIRSRLTQIATLEHLWVSTEHAFADALVATCALVIRKGKKTDQPVQRTHSLEFHNLPPATPPIHNGADQSTWSVLAADAFGIPLAEYSSEGIIGSIAEATADFRDEYYGLAGFIVEHTPGMNDKDYPPLITTGMIDPAANNWGKRSSRILKTAWNAPRVDRNAMSESGELADWIERRCRPKLLVATQSRVIELLVDESGVLLPCMPVLTVTPRNNSSMWHIAAALGSPTASAVALSRHSGTAMTTDAIKLAAKQLLRLPIPAQSFEWDRAANLYFDASNATTDTARIDLLIRAAEHMNEAFAVADIDRTRLMQWWTPRLKRTLARK